MKKTELKNMGYQVLGTLDHFIDQGKYPIRVIEAEAKLLKKHLPFLIIKKLKTDGDKYVEFVNKQKTYRNHEVTLPKTGIPTEVLAEYWKMRYDEQHERYEELYGKIKQLSEDY